MIMADDLAATPGRRRRPVLPGLQRRNLGIRERATLVAVLVIAFTIYTGGVVLLLLLSSSLHSGVEATVRARADEAAVLVAAQGPDVLGTPGARHLASGGPLQLVDPTREARSSVVFSSYSTWDTPLVDLAPSPGVTLVATPTAVAHTADLFSVVARGVRYENSSYVVIAAGRMEWVEETLGQDALTTVVGGPVLALLGGWAVWLLVGRTLRPVEEIRTAVEEMSPGDMHTRVPVPATSDEVSRLASTMNALLDRIERAQDSQRRFVADASHELRSPVAALGAGLEILAARPEEGPAVLPLLEQETRHLAALTEDLLLLARSDAGTLVRRREDVDLDDVVGHEIVRLRTAGGLRVESSVQAARVQGDPEELHRMVRNLVDNAARHADTRLGLSVYPEGREAVVIVDDDGPGIPEEERERVFERFIRLDPARGRGQGSAGLGLSIVHGIATAHGGTVSAGESPWGGARLTVRLPVDEGLVDQAGRDQVGESR